MCQAFDRQLLLHATSRHGMFSVFGVHLGLGCTSHIALLLDGLAVRCPVECALRVVCVYADWVQ